MYHNSINQRQEVTQQQQEQWTINQSDSPKRRVTFGNTVQVSYDSRERDVSTHVCYYGTLVLILVVLPPMLNAFTLLRDFNYTFWAGNTVPVFMIISCIGIILLFWLTITAFFRRVRPIDQTEPTVLSVATVFLTLFGLFLLVHSFTIHRQAADTSSNLMNRCDVSGQTRRLFNYAQVVQRIRELPSCQTASTVEDCKGYESSPPFSSYLQALESHYKCSGFCYREALDLTKADMEQVDASKIPGPKGKPVVAEEASNSSNLLLQMDTRGLATTNVSVRSLYLPESAVMHPNVALYTTEKRKLSCDGMAARSLRNIVTDIGQQTFYQGLVLVLACIIIGLSRAFGFLIYNHRKYGDLSMLVQN